MRLNMAKCYIEVKDKKIELTVRNYRNTRLIKMYFNGLVLNISKPRYVSNNEIIKMIKENEENIYKQYVEILDKDSDKIKHWVSGEKILYKGKHYKIERIETEKKELLIQIDNVNNLFKIFIPNFLKEEEIKKYIDKSIKKLFQNNTHVLIQQRLPYWSEITKISYSSFKIRDAKTKFGSCKPSTKELYFSSRLVMLPEDKVDAIIVHELCHMIHKNHSDSFYNLVKKYIPNYDEIDKWLKVNANELNL